MHFAFVLNRYVPEVDANVNCAKNVIDVLKSQGHTVTVVCGTAKKSGSFNVDGVSVNCVKKVSYNERLMATNSKIKKAILTLCHFAYSVLVLPFFPNVEPMYAQKLGNLLESVNNANKIDCVVTVFRPFATVAAGIRFKKRHPETKVVAYYLDVLKGAVKPFGIPQGFYEQLCENREVKIFPKFDLVLMAQNGKRFYDGNNRFSRVKMKYVNFPTLLLNEEIVESKKTNCTVFAYAGYLDKSYRNPMPMFEIFRAVTACGEKVKIDIYGSSNMDDEILNYQKQNQDILYYHGKVSKPVADKKLTEADCIISFGNATEGIVPSKIFEIISTKKKVVHFSPSKQDSSIQYFEKYPNALIIDLCDTVQVNCEKILNFIKTDGADISNEYLRQTFASALPETVASHILEEV